MRHWKTWAVLLLAAATLFYAATVVGHDAYGSGPQLIVRSQPGWRLVEPIDPELGFREIGPIVLLAGPAGAPAPFWVVAYAIGYFITAIGWIVALCLLVAWAFGPTPIERERRTAHSRAKSRE